MHACLCACMFVCVCVCIDEQGSDLPQMIVVKWNGVSSGRHSGDSV